jgi:hypothetical protein
MQRVRFAMVLMHAILVSKYYHLLTTAVSWVVTLSVEDTPMDAFTAVGSSP